jgi:hypothetical protein
MVRGALPHTPPKNFFEKKFSGLSKNLNNFSEVFEVSKETFSQKFLWRVAGQSPASVPLCKRKD